jgi:hypothetical protein
LYSLLRNKTVYEERPRQGGTPGRRMAEEALSAQPGAGSTSREKYNFSLDHIIGGAFGLTCAPYAAPPGLPEAGRITIISPSIWSPEFCG